MMNTEFYRGRYDEEWTRQAALQQNATTPVALLTLLGTSLAYLAQKFTSDRSLLTAAFWLVWVTSFGFGTYSAFLMFRFFHGVRYRTLDPASKWLDYQRELEATCLNHGINLEEAKKRFEIVLNESYAEAAAKNQRLNELRGKLLFVSNRVFLVAAVAVGVSVLPFAVNQSAQSPEVYRVRLIEGKESVYVRPRPPERTGRTEPVTGKRARVESTGVHTDSRNQGNRDGLGGREGGERQRRRVVALGREWIITASPASRARESCMSNPDEITLLRVHPRPSEAVTLSIPIDTLGTIREVAETRDMSPEALMKLYIGHGLRQDLARLASENDTRHPNATTLRALEDAQARDRLASFASPDELFEDLGIADPETADG